MKLKSVIFNPDRHPKRVIRGILYVPAETNRFNGVTYRKFTTHDHISVDSITREVYLYDPEKKPDLSK